MPSPYVSYLSNVPFLVHQYRRKMYHEGQAHFFSGKQWLTWVAKGWIPEWTIYRGKWMGCRIKNNLLLCQALQVRPQGAISGGLLLSNWSLLGCAQRQLHDTEVQSELHLCGARDNFVFLLRNLKEVSVKPEKMQKRLIRLIKGTEWLFSLGKYDCKERVWQKPVKFGMGLRRQTGKEHQMKLSGGKLQANTNKYFLNSRTGVIVGDRSLILKWNWTRSWKETI